VNGPQLAMNQATNVGFGFSVEDYHALWTHAFQLEMSG
jgi:hypothetical protein